MHPAPIIAARAVEVLGLVVYGGPLLAFACLFPLTPWIHGVEPFKLDRVYKAWGPGAGLGMTAIFFGGLASRLLSPRGLGWSVEDPAVLLSSLAEALFLLLICSYTILEVWTQEPLRQLDGPEGPTDAAAYALARRRVGRHLLLNLGLFLLVLVLWAGAGVLAPCHSS